MAYRTPAEREPDPPPPAKKRDPMRTSTKFALGVVTSAIVANGGGFLLSPSNWHEWLGHECVLLGGVSAVICAICFAVNRDMGTLWPTPPTSPAAATTYRTTLVMKSTIHTKSTTCARRTRWRPCLRRVLGLPPASYLPARPDPSVWGRTSALGLLYLYRAYYRLTGYLP